MSEVGNKIVREDRAILKVIDGHHSTLSNIKTKPTQTLGLGAVPARLHRDTPVTQIPRCFEGGFF